MILLSSHFTTLWILNLPKNYFRNLTQLFSFHPEQQKTLRMRNGIQVYSFFGNTFILIRKIYFQACHNFFRSQCNISFDVYPIFMVLPVVRDDSKEARRWVQCFKTRNWSKNHWPSASSFPQTQSKNESFSSNQTKILDFFHIDNFRIISTTTAWGLRWLSDISYRLKKAAFTAWHTASNVFARSNRLYCDPSQASKVIIAKQNTRRD
jgi:hypothetical protein